MSSTRVGASAHILPVFPLTTAGHNPERWTGRARELGVRHFEATLFTNNRAMLRLFDKLGCMRSHREDLDVLAIDVDLPVGDPSDEALATALRSVAEGSSAVTTV